MGHLSPEGRFVHLFFNGRYWGLYILHERIDTSFAQEHLGGKKRSFDIIGSKGMLADGSRENWDQIQNMLENTPISPTTYLECLEGIDVTNFIDYMILRIWSGDIDWIRDDGQLSRKHGTNKNWFALRKTRGSQPDEGWKFFVWDAELSMGKSYRSSRHLDFDLSELDAPNSPGRLYDRLRQNPEFRLLFGDRWHKHFHSGGSMSVTRCQQRWTSLKHSINNAILAESLRWGNATRNQPYTRDKEWLSEVTWVHDRFIPERQAIVKRQLQKQGFIPTIAAPKIISSSTTITIAASNHAAYYTLDGSDPRISGGNLNESAIEVLAEETIVPGDNILIKARCRSASGEWSSLTERRLTLN